MTAPPPGAPRWPFLPHLLFEMAQAHGLDTALAFAEAHGGTVLYIPVRATETHDIAREFGLPLLEWLIAFHDRSPTGEQRKIVVPMGPSQNQALREAAVRDLTARGLSRNQVARKLRLHARTVSAIRARLRDANGTRQMSLFDEGTP